MPIERVIQSVYSKPVRLTDEQRDAGKYDPFYTTKDGDRTDVGGEFASGEFWQVSVKASFLDADYDKMLALVDHRVELETLQLKGTTRSGKPKVRFSMKGLVDLGLADIGGEKTVEGSGAAFGEGTAQQSAVSPEPESSGEGDRPADLPVPPSSDLSELDEMWELAMAEFSAGSRAPVIVALRKMLDHPIDANKVTAMELVDVIAWKAKQK